ncbi:hypothetical protein J2Z17_001154 [Rhizobium halophytocola]|uniref:Uncharacterized protein n=1 Tax=Rhizobium halophytocola TaxID=735519 RepID=A0ABS4DVL9_9HYPH|nr:hypothetical protein [Rhizobium halophytocola]
MWLALTLWLASCMQNLNGRYGNSLDHVVFGQWY